jgi:hypothetical protein
MLDDRVRSVLARLEEEDRSEREAGVPRDQRARAVAPTTGQFLFALVAPNAGCEVLEIGGSRGYSTIWLAAAARILGGHVVSLEHDPSKCEAWRRNVAAAGLAEWAELYEGDAFALLEQLEEGFDVVFLDAEKEDYERLFALPDEARTGRRGRRRQRPLARGPARRLLGGTSGRWEPRERDRATRPRARGLRRRWLKRDCPTSG